MSYILCQHKCLHTADLAKTTAANKQVIANIFHCDFDAFIVLVELNFATKKHLMKTLYKLYIITI